MYSLMYSLISNLIFPPESIAEEEESLYTEMGELKLLSQLELEERYNCNDTLEITHFGW